MSNTAHQAPSKWFGKVFQPMLAIIIVSYLILFWPSLFSYLGIHPAGISAQILNYLFACILWILSAWLVNGLIDIFLWDWVFRSRLKIIVPTLIKDIVKIIVYAITVLAIVSNVFSASVNGFLAASGILGLIIGFGIRNLIADLFNGLALNFDHPFSRGELLMLNSPGITGVLKVVDTTWRTTRFETESNEVLVVPNSKLASIPITNLSKNPEGCFTLRVNVELGTRTEKIITLLESAVTSAKGVLTTPPPRIEIRGLKSNAAIYKISYWIAPHDILPSEAKHYISSNILEYFTQAGFILKKEVFRLPKTE